MQETSSTTSNERLWAALSWIPITPLYPILAIVALVMEETKTSAYVRHHAVQSLITGLVVAVITAITIGVGGILFLVFFYWAYQAYQGKTVELPVVTKFARQQGWIA
jgi:uncharacterized membrane protein